MRVINGPARWIFGIMLRSQIIRRILASYLYRQVIGPSESVIKLRKHEEAIDDESFWAGRLRKYAHIVDKGLHHQGFIKGRGHESYILAKRALENINSKKFRDDPSVIWAQEKLQDCEKMQRTEEPYTPGAYVSTSCDYNQLIEGIKARRSVRWYKNRIVSDEDVHRIVESINWAPSSCNRQTARVFVTNNPAIARRGIRLCTGSSGFSDFIPLFFVFAADLRLYEMPWEIILPYIDVSLGIQNCNLIAHSLGISITLLTWAGRSEKQNRELRELLSIPEYFHIVVNAAGGYPACGARVPLRKSVEQTLTLIK